MITIHTSFKAPQCSFNLRFKGIELISLSSCRNVPELYSAFLLSRQCFSQCYAETNCTGSSVEAATERDCCVGTDDGVAFHSGTSCRACVGRS